MLRKQKQSDHHITFFYAVIIVSSSATAVHNRPSNEHNLHNSFSLNNGLNLVMHSLQFVSQYTTLFVVARNPPHMTMVSSREYAIQKNHIDALSNIGKACIGSHFAYSKSSHLLSSHMNNSHFRT